MRDYAWSSLTGNGRYDGFDCIINAFTIFAIETEP